MGILSRLIGTNSPESFLLKKGFGVATCSKDCDDCSASYPASVKVESGDLFNSAKPFGLHLLVLTGKTDWPHDACSVLDSFENAVATWADSNASAFPEIGNIKVSTSSLSTETNARTDTHASAETNAKTGDILIFPFFVKLSNVPLSMVTTLLDAYIPSLIRARADGNTEVPLLPKDMPPTVMAAADSHRAHVFLCSHRTRDRRCGITAPILKREMDMCLRDLGLYRDHGDFAPDGVSVSFVNHVGGHKFSANVLIYSRNPLLFVWIARATPSNAQPIIQECILNQRVWPDSFRLVERFQDIQW